MDAVRVVEALECRKTSENIGTCANSETVASRYDVLNTKPEFPFHSVPNPKCVVAKVLVCFFSIK